MRLCSWIGVQHTTSHRFGYASSRYGVKPRFSFGGSASTGSSGFSRSVVTAPTDKDMRITDLQISACCDNNAYGANVSLVTASGQTLGSWNVNRNTILTTNMESGLLLPAGEELIINGYRNNYSVTVYYTISGQYVRP